MSVTYIKINDFFTAILFAIQQACTQISASNVYLRPVDLLEIYSGLVASVSVTCLVLPLALITFFICYSMPLLIIISFAMHTKETYLLSIVQAFCSTV